MRDPRGLAMGPDMKTDRRYQALPLREQARLSVVEKTMRRIDSAPKKSEAYQHFSAIAKKRNPDMRGLSATNLEKLHRDRWRKSGGDWRSLVNCSRIPGFTQEPPDALNRERREFANFMASIHSVLRAMSLRGEPIPGRPQGA